MTRRITAAAMVAMAVMGTVGASDASANGWRPLRMQEAEKVAAEYARFVQTERNRRVVVNNAALDWKGGGLYIAGPSPSLLLAFHVQTDGRRYRVQLPGSTYVSVHNGRYVTGTWPTEIFVRDVMTVSKSQQITGSKHAIWHSYGRKNKTRGYYGVKPYGCRSLYSSAKPVDLFNTAFGNWLNGNRGGAGCSPGSSRRDRRPAPARSTGGGAGGPAGR